MKFIFIPILMVSTILLSSENTNLNFKSKQTNFINKNLIKIIKTSYLENNKFNNMKLSYEKLSCNLNKCQISDLKFSENNAEKIELIFYKNSLKIKKVRILNSNNENDYTKKYEVENFENMKLFLSDLKTGEVHDYNTKIIIDGVNNKNNKNNFPFNYMDEKKLNPIIKSKLLKDYKEGFSVIYSINKKVGEDGFIYFGYSTKLIEIKLTFKITDIYLSNIRNPITNRLNIQYDEFNINIDTNKIDDFLLSIEDKDKEKFKKWKESEIDDLKNIYISKFKDKEKNKNMWKFYIEEYYQILILNKFKLDYNFKKDKSDRITSFFTLFSFFKRNQSNLLIDTDEKFKIQNNLK